MIVGAHHILIIEYVAEKIDGQPLLRLLQRNADTPIHMMYVHAVDDKGNMLHSLLHQNTMIRSASCNAVTSSVVTTIALLTQAIECIKPLSIPAGVSSSM